MDSRLRFNPKIYEEFVRDLDKRDLLFWTQEPKNVVTPFFVTKKSGKLRLILDCRATNELFVGPPGVALCSAEGLARLELPCEEDMVYTASGDVADCFHRFKTWP
eukprot:11108736-Lingulodinium_polyedra.AAC.1